MFKFVKCLFGAALVATTSYLVQDVALAGGGFSASCLRITVTPNGATLYADCYTQNQWLASSDLSLTSHIANDDGHLAWQKNGGFSASVKGCNLGRQSTTLILGCQARRRDGSYVNASIALDDEIANYNGTLTVLNGF